MEEIFNDIAHLGTPAAIIPGVTNTNNTIQPAYIRHEPAIVAVLDLIDNLDADDLPSIVDAADAFRLVARVHSLTPARLLQLVQTWCAITGIPALTARTVIHR